MEKLTSEIYIGENMTSLWLTIYLHSKALGLALSQPSTKSVGGTA